MSIKDIDITKLNGSNYATWRFRMEMILVKEDLFDIVENETPIEAQNAEFTKRDRKARALINLCISDSEIVHVKYETSARDTWLKLKSVHERKNLSSKLFLLRKLYSIKLEEGGNMKEHISNILEISDQLRSIGEEIKTTHKAALLLVSLPRSYDTLVTALEARQEEELTLEFISEKLICEYNRRSEQKNERQTASSHVYKAYEKTNKPNFNKTPNQNFSTPRKSVNKNDKYCNYCKRRSHDISQCYFLQNKNKSNYNKSLNNNNNKNSMCFAIKELPMKNSSLKQIETSSDEEYSELNETAKRISDSRCESLPPTFRLHSAKKNENTQLKNAESNEDESFKGAFREKNVVLSNHTTSVYSQNGSTETHNPFIIDSAATSNLVNDKNLFVQLNEEHNPMKICLADGNTVSTKGIGIVKFISKLSNGTCCDITLNDALYVPSLQSNLLSVNKMTQKGYEVKFKNNKCFVMKNNITYIEAESCENGLYRVICEDNNEKISEQNVCSAITCDAKDCIRLWHRRMGHRSDIYLHQLVNENLAEGISLNKCKHSSNCADCIKSKLTQNPYPKSAKHRSTEILELIHSDVAGPFDTPTISHKRYFLTLIDDYSRYTTIYLLNSKDEAFSKIKEYIAHVKNKFDKNVKAIRSDQGGEYILKQMDLYLKNLGIDHQFTVAYSSPSNGTAERKNRTLVEMVRCMLSESKLGHSYWGEAVCTANYIQNRLPTKANTKTPYELWTGRKPDLKNMRVFGCKAYAYVHNRGKLDDKAIEGIFLGYDDRSKGYRIGLNNNKVIISRTVKFIEEESQTIPETSYINDVAQQEIKDEKTEENEEEILPRRSQRPNIGVPPERLTYLSKTDSGLESKKPQIPVEPAEFKEPKDWQEVMNINNPVEKQHWINATKEEINSLQKNKTWTLVDPPEGKHIIGSKWTFKSKLNSEGKVEKYKARLVARGYSQKFGDDYDETFASVVSHTTIRAMLAAAAHKNLNVQHIDVKTAFLHGDLSEEVYMAQPEGYLIPGKEHQVCKLQKAIYGLKQAARAWQTKINETLQKLNFTQSKNDACLYFKETDKNPIYVIVYVDDILIAGKKKQIDETVAKLNEKFEIKNLGDVNYYLGINIRKTSEGYYALSQKLKINEVINKFNLNEAKPCYTPMEPGYLQENDETNLLPDNKKYRQAIGALLYIATITRPDILASVNILSRRNEKPRKRDWEQVKRIIKYLKTTINLELHLDPDDDPVLECYADADWAGDKNDRKSTSGNLFLLGKAPISWYSKKQSNITLSSAEAEYVSAANATKEILWLLKLLEDLNIKQTLPIKIYEDNIPCIKIVEMEKYNYKLKHIDVKYHYIKEMKKKDIIDLQYCPTQEMAADVLTKPVSRPCLERHMQRFRLLIDKGSVIRGSVRNIE